MSRAESLGFYAVLLFLVGIIANGLGVEASQITPPNTNTGNDANVLLSAFNGIWILVTFEIDLNPTINAIVVLFLAVSTLYTGARLIRGGG